MSAPGAGDPPRSVILVTGAAGRIGRQMARALYRDPQIAAAWSAPPSLRLTDIRPDADTPTTIITGDLADAGFVDSLFADGQVRAVVHCAGYPREAGWDVLLDANIRASIHLWDSAHRHGVERIVFASSNHVTGLYPTAERIGPTDPPRPDSCYGLTKLFGEHLGQLYAYRYGLRAFCIRIGTCLPEPLTPRMLDTWISADDLAQLVRIGLTTDHVFRVVYGVSANERTYWDDDAARMLGYTPSGTSSIFRHLFPEPAPDTPFQGGPYAAADAAEAAAILARIEADRAAAVSGDRP